jgi:hypothetical protein
VAATPDWTRALGGDPAAMEAATFALESGEEIGVDHAIRGSISAVRSSRQPQRGFLTMRKFLNAIDHVPHAEGATCPEEPPQAASRRGRVSKHAPKSDNPEVSISTIT